MNRFIEEQKQAANNLGFCGREKYMPDHPSYYVHALGGFRSAYSFTKPFYEDGSPASYMRALMSFTGQKTASQLVSECSWMGYKSIKYSGLVTQKYKYGPYTLSPLGETYVKTMLEIRKKYF